MEAGEYNTNTLVIHNISSVAYRTYELSPTTDYQSQPNPTAIQDVEALFRSRGCIAHYDTLRRIIWHFGVTHKDDASSANAAGPALPDNLDIPGITLSPVDSGAFEPASLPRPRLPAPHGSNTPTSGAPSSAAADIGQQARAASSFSPASGSPPVLGFSDHDASGFLTANADLGLASLGAITFKDAYENFILALLGTIQSGVVKQLGGVPLDGRAILLFPGQSSGGMYDAHISTASAVASFRIYLTPNGSLIVGLSLTPGDGLSPLDRPLLSPPPSPLAETPVLVAPFGIRGFLQATFDAGFGQWDHGVAQTPDTQVSRFQEARSSRWRQVCTRLLQLKGLSAHVLDSCAWIAIRIPRQRYHDPRGEGKSPGIFGASATVSWPASLCFRKQHASLPPMSRLGGNMLVGHTESYDPLSSAKAWFQGASERSDALARRKQEREMATARGKADDQVSVAPQANGTSPLALQRAGNATAMAAGVMYPTPPDAIQNPAAPTPNLDGAVSSPHTQPPAVSVVDTDVVMSNAPPLSEPYAERDRAEVPFLADSDNLFDDFGGDMFNDAELTDADFNFFDEQPPPTKRETDVLTDLTNFEPQVHVSEPSTRIPEPPPPPPHQPQPSGTQPAIRGNQDKPAFQDPPIKREGSPVFAKPELRHARSTMGVEAQAGAKAVAPPRTKREHSPFDPDTVFKRVRTAVFQPGRCNSGQAGRRRSAYDKVEFDLVLPPVTSKYVNGGKYAFNWTPVKQDKSPKPRAPPTTDYWKRHGKQSRMLKPVTESPGALIARITSGIESSSIQQSPVKHSNLIADVDNMSIVSDQDDSSTSSDEVGSPIKSAGFRRTNNEDDLISHATSFRDRDMDVLDEPDPSFALELPRLSRSGTPDLPLAKLFADPEPLALQLSLPDTDMIAVAQILTEQATLGTLEVPSDVSLRKPAIPPPERRRHLASLARQAMQALHDSIPPSLGLAAECQLRAFTEIQDGTPLAGPPARPPHLQPRPVPGRDPAELMKPPTVYQIPPPHLELRRADNRLSVLPAAVTFWDSLGLGPAMGPKDVQAACVFPGWDGMADNVRLFLDRLRSVYESMKLGTFERLPSTSDITDGIVQYDVDRISVTPGHVFPRISAALAERTELLCQALRATPAMEKNLVVFFVYSPANPSSIIEACTSFQQLSEAYRTSASYSAGRRSGGEPPNDVVLQLVPLDAVCAPTSVVIQSAQDLARLCLETYDRCSLSEGPYPAPAVMLEQVSPRYIDFSLSSAPSASVMHENSCIHVAYARSADGRWITAAWTDTRGCQQVAASYCLGRKGRAGLATSFDTVAEQIWETTKSLIARWRVHWRVVITRCGPMDAEEVEVWRVMYGTENNASVSMVLLTVDSSPSLQLIPPAVRMSPAVVASGAGVYSTPVSTPQPSILSPEQSGNPPTPANNAPTPGGGGGGGGGGGEASTPAAGDNSSADGVLMDVVDQSWGCILAHRLSNSGSATEVNPSLFSGYLIKRGGPRTEDPPVAMELNLVFSEANPRQYEGLVREMLGHFRALGTLARVRGVTDREGDVRPWHVAAAEKAVRALYLLM